MRTTHMLSEMTGLGYRVVEHRQQNASTMRVPDHDAIIEMYNDRKAWLKWKNSGQVWPDGFGKDSLGD